MGEKKLSTSDKFLDGGQPLSSSRWLLRRFLPGCFFRLSEQFQTLFVTRHDARFAREPPLNSRSISLMR